MMKPCIKCRKRLPLSAYYKHPEMADGHLNKCKDCVRAAVQAHRAANAEKIREYDKQRAKLPHRLELNKRTNAEWAKQNPQARKAQIAVGNAVRDGRLMKLPCFICGSEKSVAHHPDYSMPLAVAWMCQAHHKQTHVMAATLQQSA